MIRRQMIFAGLLLLGFGFLGADTSNAMFMLSPAEAGDPNVPDLVYFADTGEVVLDSESTDIIGYVLENATDSFLPANHTAILGGVGTSLTSITEEATLSPFTGSASIGAIFPTGMDLTDLDLFLTNRSVSRTLGSPIVDFDLVVVSNEAVVPEPSTYAMAGAALAGLGICAWRRRQNAVGIR